MQRKLSRFSKFFDVVDKMEDIVCGGTLAALLFIVLLQVGARWCGIILAWTEETTRFLFLWMMFIAVAAGFNRAESARVVVLIQKFPLSAQKVCAAAYYIVSIAFFLFMLYYGTELSLQKFKINEMATALALPMGFIMISVPISGFLGIIGTIQSYLEYSHLVATGGDNSEIGMEGTVK